MQWMLLARRKSENGRCIDLCSCMPYNANKSITRMVICDEEKQ